jgi:hypothetical protein
MKVPEFVKRKVQDDAENNTSKSLIIYIHHHYKFGNEKSRRILREKHVTRIGELRNVYKIRLKNQNGEDYSKVPEIY